MNVQYLFVDMNSYFAAVEQQLRPELRGRPVAVVPVLTDATSCIAASYEAKAIGVKTGTRVGEARFLCPEITLLPSRTEVYVQFHQRIVAAVNSVLPVHKVLSVDEMVCRLTGPDATPTRGIELARAVKRAIKQQVGEYLRCSIGLAPNPLLAKLASDLQKPDGLTQLQRHELPDRLHGVPLSDFAGIGPRMLRRMHQAGIRTTAQLCAASQPKLRDVWGGVVGERWWHWLRGDDLPEVPTHRSSVGHSHVLAPVFRSDPLAYQVLVKLLSKAATRLRQLRQWARRLTISIRYVDGGSWSASARLALSQDTSTMLAELARLWTTRPQPGVPLKVEVNLDQLQSTASCAPPLFPEQRRGWKLAQVMDRINERLGDGSVYVAAMHEARETAPDRIAFQSIPQVSTRHMPER